MGCVIELHYFIGKVYEIEKTNTLCGIEFLDVRLGFPSVTCLTVTVASFILAYMHQLDLKLCLSKNLLFLKK